jgi:hypothetical protein
MAAPGTDASPPDDEESDNTGSGNTWSDESGEALPSGWVRLVRNGWVTEFATTGSIMLIWLVVLGNTTNLIVDDVAFHVRLLVWLGIVLGGLLVIFAWYRFRPFAQVNFDTDEIRRGRRTMPLSDIRWARLEVVETQKSRSIAVAIGAGKWHIGSEGIRRGLASYVVRTAGGQTPPLERARLVAEVLRRSTIELPETSDDPTGKFTWFNFPGSLTREQAIEIVLNPPAFGDPLPVPSSHLHDPPRPGLKRDQA